MKKNCFFFAFIICFMFLSACAGPYTRVIRHSDRFNYGDTESADAPADADPNRMAASMAVLSSFSRTRGSRGEEAAAHYIAAGLSDLGYDVFKEDGRVVAVLNASHDDADILHLAVTFGTSAFSDGAAESAAGTAVLLETAALLARKNTDTQIRLAFLPGSAHQTGPSHAYINSLSEDEISRSIGMALLGHMGVQGADAWALSMPSAQTMIGNDLLELLPEKTGMAAHAHQQDDILANVFYHAGIPALSLSDERSGIYTGTRLDILANTDMGSLCKAADAIAAMAAFYMSDETPSLVAKARYVTPDAKKIFCIKRDKRLPFGCSEEEFDLLTGFSGDAGSEQNSLLYDTDCFFAENTVPAEFVFVGGGLYEAKIHFQDEKQADSLRAFFDDCFEYADENMFAAEEAQSFDAWDVWKDEKNGNFYILEEKDSEITVSIRDYLPDIHIYDTNAGFEYISSYVKKLLSLKTDDFISCRFFTDGHGHGSIFTADRASQDISAGYDIWVDPADILLGPGELADEDAFLKEILRAYADILSREYPVEADICRNTGAADFPDAFVWYVLSDENMVKTDPQCLASYMAIDRHSCFLSARENIRHAMGIYETAPGGM